MADLQLKHSEAAEALLFANLGYFDSVIPDPLKSYLRSILDKAFDDFADIMGILLQPGNPSDDFDQVAYAAWLYRNGAVGADKTEMLKSIKRNRQVSNALKSEV